MKYKICVYAICKNEEKFVDKWYDSIKDADYICVLDTGSNDNTVKLLKEKGIKVKTKIISPWRFDVARNESMKLIPKDADICICLDLDEILLPNWKNELINLWDNSISRINYIYNWYIDENNIPKISYYGEKIHANNKYTWTHPVHEVLTYTGKNQEKIVKTNTIIINHYPDWSKSRKSYLPLLELSVKENPNNDRNLHYLGREYMYYKKWNKSIDTLIKHINLKSSLWKDEKSASMRYIARCYIELKRYNEAEMWLINAINETPYLKEPYVEISFLYYKLKDWDNIIKYLNKSLKIDGSNMTYINEIFTKDETVYDLLSVAYFYKGNINLAIRYAKKALKINSFNERIKKNLLYFKSQKN